MDSKVCTTFVAPLFGKVSTITNHSTMPQISTGVGWWKRPIPRAITSRLFACGFFAKNLEPFLSKPHNYKSPGKRLVSTIIISTRLQNRMLLLSLTTLINPTSHSIHISMCFQAFSHGQCKLTARTCVIPKLFQDLYHGHTHTGLNTFSMLLKNKLRNKYNHRFMIFGLAKSVMISANL
jgi:hypothetical protein